eukprot:TRINITY_DN58_c0_g1_i1.p1 TRINITY_DN58_c0_g1~~TRINITY_DN58_c0_g1_i1.p1  ORF type:complete len:116 (+),score=10.75 TRINITY_DN58_c0_g1_i1:1-348(+)
MEPATIYHIISKADYETAKKRGSHAAAIAKEGFIHFSQAHQVIGTLNRIFKGNKDLLLLSIDVKKLKAKLIYEKSESALDPFPHLYGELNLDAITGEATITPKADGSFDAESYHF